MSCDVECSSTEARGPPASLQPILLHGADQAQGSVCNETHAAAKIQAVRKAVNVQARVNRPASRCMLYQSTPRGMLIQLVYWLLIVLPGGHVFANQLL